MKKHTVKNGRFFVIPIISFLLLILAIGLLIFQLSKVPKEVKAVAGDIKFGAGAGGVGCEAGEIIMGGGTAVKSSCGSFETAFASKTPQFAGLSVTGTITAPTFSGALFGNATTATTATNLSGFTNSNSGSPVSADSLTNNGIAYVNSGVPLFGQTDGALYAQAYSTSWVGQIYQDYRTGQIALRGKNNGIWTAWRTNVDSGNIGSQSVNYANYAGYSAYLSGANAYTNGSDGWWRSNGSAGWYNATYAVGVYATQAGRVDLYNGASLYVPGAITSVGTVTAPTFSGALSGNATTATSTTWLTGGLYGSLGSSYSNHVQVREANLAGAGTSLLTEAPAIGFHWSGRVASNIIMLGDGSIQIRNNPGTGYETFKAGNIYMNDNLVIHAGNIGSQTVATATNNVLKSGDTMTGQLWINNASPTIYFKDTDHRGAMLHNNSNLFYILRGCEATNSTTWCTVGGVWPFYINLENNTSNFGGAITATSDIRLKTNIKPLPENILEKVNKLRGVYFNWKTEADMGNNRQIGMIAQEVEGIFPELVGTGADGYKTFAYDRLGPILIEAVKEQQKEIDALKSEVSNLKKEMDIIKQILKTNEK